MVCTETFLTLSFWQRRQYSKLRAHFTVASGTDKWPPYK